MSRSEDWPRPAGVLGDPITSAGDFDADPIEEVEDVHVVSRCPGLAARCDAPTLKKSKRGRLSVALEVATSTHLMQEAAEELDRDKYARTSSGPRDTWLRTWIDIHENIYCAGS